MRIGKSFPLKTYVGVAGTIVLTVFLLSLLKVVPNLQYSRGAVIRLGLFYPTDFSLLFLPMSPPFAKRSAYWLRSLSGILL